MKNSLGEIIYVGKAKVLKNRVRQYFQKNKNHSTKVKSMVKNIAEFEYIERSDLLRSLSDTMPYLKSKYGTSLIVHSVQLFALFVLLYEVHTIPTVRLNHICKHALVVILDH